MIRQPFIVEPCYQGEDYPGPPLTDDELAFYFAKVDELATLWSRAVDLMVNELLTADEWALVIYKLQVRSDELQFYSDRIGYEIDNSPSAIATARIITQYNLGLLKEVKPIVKRTFRSKLARIFTLEAERVEREKQREATRRAFQAQTGRRRDLGEETDQDRER